MSSDVSEKLPSVASASCHYQMFVRAVGRLKERDKLASQARKLSNRCQPVTITLFGKFKQGKLLPESSVGRRACQCKMQSVLVQTTTTNCCYT
jgi:hypothetical protein